MFGEKLGSMSGRLFIWIMFISSYCFAQTSEVVNGSYSGTPLKEVLGEIEHALDIKFYYDQNWIDTVLISGEFKELSLESALDQLLLNHDFSYLINSNEIILSYKKPILSTFAISGFFNDQIVYDPIEKGLIFEKEIGNEINQVDKEGEIYEIGSRNKYENSKTVTVAGYITQSENKNPVEGAFVYLQAPFMGTTTDTSGFYALNVPSGEHVLLLQSIEMKNTYRNIVVFSEGTMNIEMEVDIIALNEVTVTSDRDNNIQQTQMGVTRIGIEETKNVPVLLGERDIVKAATTTSGVQVVGEGAAGVNIRGGKADQNLFIIDGAPIYNTSHFFGFFSIFNSEAIEEMELFKGGIPAKYGGRLSSVFDITTKEPNKEKYSVKGGIGPITSNLLFEGPIIKDKTSLMLGGRATYSDFVLKQISNSPLGNQNAVFHDLIVKIDHKIDQKNTLLASGYYSFDSFQLDSDSLLGYSDFSYTNANFSVKWMRKFNDDFNGSLRLTGSQYRYDIGYDQLPSQAFEINYDIAEWAGTVDFNYYLNDKNHFNFGANTKRYQINPGIREPLGELSDIRYDEINPEQALESAVYFSNQYDPTKNISLYAGLRYSLFTHLGPSELYQYALNKPLNNDFITDTLSYGKGASMATYHGPELRLSGRFSLPNLSSVKVGYNRSRQYVHMLINSAALAPTDIWRLSGKYLAPQIADQFSIGYYKNIVGNDVLEFSVEGYYKLIKNLVDFKVGADLQFNKNIETDLLQGDGRSYGLELSAKKSDGWFTGWVNYTWSRSFIRLNGDFAEERVNRGAFFETSYDKPHYLNLVTNYKFTRRYSLSLNLVYSSGRPVTYPIGKWQFNNAESLLYSDRNAFRIPDYFRVDLGFDVEGTHKIKKLAHSFWTFSVYNVLGRDNVYSIFFKTENGAVEGYKMTVFSNPIPTITFNFKI